MGNEQTSRETANEKVREIIRQLEDLYQEVFSWDEIDHIESAINDLGYILADKED